VLVMDDFLSDINWRSIVIEGLLNRDNCAVDASAVPSWGGQKHAPRGGIVYLGHSPSLREIISPP